MCRVRDFELLSLHQSTSFPQGSGSCVKEEAERMLEPEEMNDSKEIVSSRHNRMNAHMNSQ